MTLPPQQKRSKNGTMSKFLFMTFKAFYNDFNLLLPPPPYQALFLQKPSTYVLWPQWPDSSAVSGSFTSLLSYTPLTAPTVIELLSLLKEFYDVLPDSLFSVTFLSLNYHFPQHKSEIGQRFL